MIKKYYVLALLLFHGVVWCMDHQKFLEQPNLYKQALLHAASQHVHNKETVPLVSKIVPKKEEIVMDIREEAPQSPKPIFRFSAAVEPDWALIQPQKLCICNIDRGLCVKMTCACAAMTLAISFAITMFALKVWPR